VQLGGQTFIPQQRFLAEEKAFDVVVQFRREHPHRLRFFSTVLGWGNCATTLGCGSTPECTLS
jgi:hypothetical protein